MNDRGPMPEGWGGSRGEADLSGEEVGGGPVTPDAPRPARWPGSVYDSRGDRERQAEAWRQVEAGDDE